ncbi:MAG: acetate kinase, partial [Deltaproteobacteria bacterium]|nr:acetate kinase [Deltaproteobacteria bacterium]
MKILVINTGSSSIKYELFDMDNRGIVASGTVEKIGEESSRLVHTCFSESGEPAKREKEGVVNNHQEGLTLVVELLMDPKNGAIREK